MIEYKGYMAAIEYDDDEGVICGHVVNTGVDSIPTFTGTDAAGLKREFTAAVDAYLASCEADGVEPQKPFSGKVRLHLGPALQHKVTEAAEEDGVTVNAWVKQAVKDMLSPKRYRRPML